MLDLKNVIYVDSSGADTLNDLARLCHQNKVRLIVCGLSHQALDIARRSGFVERVGAEHIFPNLNLGLAALQTEENPVVESR